MAKFEQRDNSGVLFKNRTKEQPQHRDYEGSATIAGVEYWVSAWVKDGQMGKFMSLSFKPKQQRAEPEGSLADEMDDSVPF